ncbi:tyrosine-type recombinase/integrase [Hyphomonas sp.]|uniref:tyrosine-type recombinase/integrase n=1 Tax=Hyphomonas sp. TaxID=87 RepID=UPI0025C20FF9|nr:tyrosine-type recombinase/integrase [Hyphomonas sp.]
MGQFSVEISALPGSILNGNQHTSTTDRRVAARRLEDIKDEIRKAIAEGPQTTFVQAAVPYMADRKEVMAAKGLAYHKSAEARYMKTLLDHLGPDRTLASLTPPAIDAIARELYPNTKAVTRRRQAVTPIRAVINHQNRGGLILPSDAQRRIRWLTPEEAEQLIRGARRVDEERSCGPAMCERLILLLLGTGCRTSELVNLMWDNINLKTAEAYVADPKNGISRWSSIERARTLAHLLLEPGDGAVMLTPKGQPYRIRENNSGGQFAVIFNKARDYAGLEADGPMKVTPHVLRHTWATWFWVASRHNLVALQRNGGWEDSRTAMLYTKLAPADLSTRLRAHGWNFANGGDFGEGVGRAQLRAV